MNCSSCHLDDGRMPFSAPIWPAAVTLPDYRGKNKHVNNLEERIAGCFTYSMNGKPPKYGSDNLVALSAYHAWLATGVELYPTQPIYGRGFPAPERPEKLSYARGKELYSEKCAVCHQPDGTGLWLMDIPYSQLLGVTCPIIGGRHRSASHSRRLYQKQHAIRPA
jgi:thiosulfate dehydrogenase